ncbi:MAG: hypothetical protein CM15mV63_440 [uncultured marine virus]|nr:MAG: hypothetical protein CM15mV63_440 [uncultured marine virus]
MGNPQLEIGEVQGACGQTLRRKFLQVYKMNYPKDYQ